MGTKAGTSLAAAAASVAALLLCAAPAMAEPCASSTPSQASFPHTPQQTLVPQVAAITVAVDAACTLTVQNSITDRPAGLLTGDSLGWYLNTDGNPATGDSTFAGADFVVMLLGTQQTPALIAFNQAAGKFDAAGFTPLTRAGFGFSVNLNALNAVPGTFTMTGASSWRGTRSYSDFIPPVTATGAGTVSFPVAFTSTAPTPAPAPAPTPAPASPPAAAKCQAPRVTGKTLRSAKRAIRRANCTVGTVTKPKARRGSKLVVVKQRTAGQRVNVTLGPKRS